MIPTQTQLEIPLLQTIYNLGGSPEPRDVYPALAQILNLTTEDLSEEYENGRNKFQVFVQFTREKLAKKEQLSRLNRGKWVITDAGIERLIDAGIIESEAISIEEESEVSVDTSAELDESGEENADTITPIKEVLFRLPDSDMDTIVNKDFKVNQELYTNPLGVLKKIQEVLLIEPFCVFSIVSAINAGFHVMLYGPPGTAKTTISKVLPVYLYAASPNLHTADNSWSVKTTIGGLKVKYLNESGSKREYISPVDGYITQDIFDAYKNIYLDGDEGTPYQTSFSVIDEFNRTNMDECMGPLFTAMGSENNVLKLDYYEGYNEKLRSIQIPKCFRMICSMNKYDRTFTTELSEALTRRFKWIYVGPPSEYIQESDLVLKRLFNNTSSEIGICADLTDIPKIEEIIYLEDSINKIFDIINQLRNNDYLNLGTSYKFDSVKILYQYFYIIKNIIKLRVQGAAVNAQEKTTFISKLDDYSNSYDNLINAFSTSDDNNIVKEIIDKELNGAIDATLCMCIIPACEAIESSDVREQVKELFESYPNSLKELKRIILF